MHATITLVLYGSRFSVTWRILPQHPSAAVRIRDKMLRLVDKSRGLWDCWAEVDGERMPFAWR